MPVGMVIICSGGHTCRAPQDSLYVDEMQTWKTVSGTEANGALLVRPDGHVAWRCRALSMGCRTEMQDSINLQLQRAVARTLALPC